MYRLAGGHLIQLYGTLFILLFLLNLNTFDDIKLNCKCPPLVIINVS